MLDEMDVQRRDFPESGLPERFPSESYSAELVPVNSKTGNLVGVCLAAVGIGAALMFVFDPVRGRRRRSILLDKSASLLKKGSDNIQSAADRGRDRLSGVLASARHALDYSQTDDDLLVSRVRSQLGHVIERPHDVEVLVNQGHVILRGKVGAEEVQDLVRAVGSIHGVKKVENQMLGSMLEKPHTASLSRLVAGFGVALGLLKLLKNS